MNDNPWDAMRSGQTREAIQMLRDRYESNASASHAMSLGVAYLLNSEFELAWQHFDDFNKAHRYRMSKTFGMAGVAQWCLGRRDDAVTEWFNGLKCDYADAAGGIEIPLLLFFASVAAPQSVQEVDVQNELLRKICYTRISNWPGPLALFVLGKIDEERLTTECRGNNQADATSRETMKNFYVAIVRKQHHQSGEAERYMQSVANLTWDDYDMSNRAFLTKAWHEELYLARAELKKS